MPSTALAALLAALAEVDSLDTAQPGIAGSLAVSRAVGRAAIVLLSGHFERYFYAVNEEAVTFFNTAGVASTVLPVQLRLLHSRYPVDELAEMQWLNRETKLEQFIRSDGWLWQRGLPGATDHERLLAWMRSPDPDNLLRFYRYWGIEDIFGTVTRTQQSRGRLWLAVKGLVDKRN